MAYSPNEPIFADRYRFEPIDSDWDRGRSGFTHLVSDVKNNERKGVIKRAESTSKQATIGLKNEANALRKLKKLGLGVPEIYAEGKANYLSKNYDYIVIEYIGGVRVENEVSTLPNSERAEILTQFLNILARAHHEGIVNGDVDLKHLFWRRDKKELIVIDWGNAILNVDKAKKGEFAYDLARTAEIIYALVVGKTPLATESIALPKDQNLVPGLAPLPAEFRDICQWAPRTPIAGAKAPHSAAELFEVAIGWKKAVKNNKRYVPKQPWGRHLALVIIVLALVTIAGLLVVPNVVTHEETPTSIKLDGNTVSPTLNNFTATATISLSESTLTSTEEVSLLPSPSTTPDLAVTRLPKTYSPFFIIDNTTPEEQPCWVNTLNEAPSLKFSEALSRRADGYWSFRADKSRTVDDRIKTDFSGCLGNNQVNAISINIWVSQIERPRELGFFLEDVNGNRREYTIWLERVNNADKMYLRVRDDTISTDYELLSTNYLESQNAFPRIYYRFSFLAFLEIDNEGFDILYLKEIPQQKFRGQVITDPSQLIRADNAMRTTLGDIKSIGLIIYGGETESAIWPLVLLLSP